MAVLNQTKQAQKAKIAENNKAAKAAIASLNQAMRVNRWQPTFESLIAIAGDQTNIRRALKAAKLLVKLACYMETGRYSHNSMTGSTKSAPQTPGGKRSGKWQITLPDGRTVVGTVRQCITAWTGKDVSLNANVFIAKHPEFGANFQKVAPQ